MQWQSEYKNCMQKAQQFEVEKQQRFSLNPDLENCLQLSQEELAQMQKDYANLPKEISVSEQNETNASVSNLLFIISAVLAVIGIVWMISSIVPGLIVFIIGAGIFVYSFMQKNKLQKSQNEAKREETNITNQYHNFEQKYQLDAHNLDLKEITNQVRQYRLQENSEKANNEQMTDLNSKTVQLASAIENMLKRPVSANFEEMLSAIDNLDDQVDQTRHSDDKKASLETDLVVQKQKLTELILQLKAIFAQDNVEEIGEYEERYQESLAQAELKTRIATLENSLKEQLPELEKFARDSSELNQKRDELENTISQENAKINSLQGETARLQVKMNNLADSTAVFEAKQN